MSFSLPIADVSSDAPRLLKKRQKHSRWFVALLVAALLFIDGTLDSESDLYDFMQWLGTLLVAVCVLGRSYCSAYIGGVKNDMIMRDGPFSVVRNPLYVFSFIGVAGIGLASGMISLMVLLLVVFAVYYKYVVSHEEAFLLNKFGDDYRSYQQEVPRWWPKWSLWKEPEQIIVRPRFLRRTMSDALAFFLPLPCFELLSVLHQEGILPTYILLP